MRYEFTSLSVTSVLRGCRVAFSACALIVATFCLRSIASRRDVRTSACIDTPSAATRQTASFIGPFYRVRLRLWAVGLARARDELQHPLLHLLLEDAEPRLLADVEDLVDRLVRLADFGLRPILEILQRLHLFLHRRLVGLRIVGQPSQLLQPAVALLQRAAPDVLEGLEARQESRELLLGDLQLVLRLHQRVGVEHAPDFLRRDGRLVQRAGGARRQTLTALASGRLRAGDGGRRRTGAGERD